MDYLNASLTIEAKSFKAEVNIICNRYLCETRTDGMQLTFAERSSKHTTTCPKMGLGSKKLAKRIWSLRSPLRLQNYKPNLRIKISELLLLRLKQRRTQPLTLPLKLAALAVRRESHTPSQLGAWLRKWTKSACMVKIIFGAQAIIGAVALGTMGWTLITKLTIMNLGGLASMNAEKKDNDGQSKETS